jgi:hypothetical protein
MDDVIHSLADLIAMRRQELGYGGSLAAMYRAAGLPSDGISYQSFRRLAKGEASSTRRPTTVRDLALICRVSEEQIRSAEAGYTPPGGWQKYDRLTESEKKAVEGVMDAILAARDEEVSDAGRSPKDQKTPDEHEPERTKGGSDDGRSEAQKSGLTWQERRRQRMIDQAQNVAEAADDHPRQADYEVADEDISQDPDDWGQDG